jgi:hypothetical protein
VLVRRDNIEHLLMIGGPTDIVVEPNIVRAQPVREQIPVRAAVPATEPSWQDAEVSRAEPLDLGEPIGAPEPPRAPRTAFPDEPRRPQPPRAPEPRSRPAADPFAGLAAELTSRAEPAPREQPRATPRSEPLMPRPARPSAEPPPLKAPPPVRPPERPQPAASADQNLAEMAQRLEAALRRPGGEAKADGADRAPPVAPEAPPRAARSTPPEVTPPAADDGNASAATPTAPFKNLEEEMASLLGRPKPPS